MGTSLRVARFAFLISIVVSGCSKNDSSGVREEVHDAAPSRRAEGGAVPRPPADVIGDFIEAWSTDDADQRASLFEASFAANGVYTDPSQTAKGRAALVDAVTGLRQLLQGATLSAVTRIDLLRGQYRFGWQLTSSSVTQSGEDEGQIGPDGKIARVTGFSVPASTGAEPSGFAPLLRALNASDRATLQTELGSAATDDITWTDRSAHTTTVAGLVDHLVTLLSPGSGVHFTVVGDVDAYSDFFRAQVTSSGGYASQNGELIGHASADGRLDWVSYFDGDLSK